MDAAAVLCEKILEHTKLNGDRILFRVVQANGSTIPITYRDIETKISCYEPKLKNLVGKICAVLHTFDADFIGFIIAALKNHVRILIRRTGIQSEDELREEINFLRRVVPAGLIFTDKNFLSFADTDDITKGDWGFVQCSSGTVSEAKAFCLGTAALTKSAEHIVDAHHINENSICASYLTMSHIFGFVTGFVVPILSGAACLHFPTALIKQTPSILADLITKEKISHISMIPATIEQFLRSPSRSWDFSSIICAGIGGSKVSVSTYRTLQRDLAGYKMSPKALINSYGMSELGAITMENPFSGNKISSDGHQLAVGNSTFFETQAKIFNDGGQRVPDGVVGKIGISSPYLAKFYFRQRKLCRVEKIFSSGESYYFNGDCGFIDSGKLYVTGRTSNTLTFNGLKISGESVADFAKKFLADAGFDIGNCLFFNLPNETNKIICFAEYGKEIPTEIFSELNGLLQKKFHLTFADYFLDSHTAQGIGKISLPETISRYNELRKVTPNATTVKNPRTEQ